LRDASAGAANGLPTEGHRPVLDSYGWNDALQQQFCEYTAQQIARGLAPARVIVQQRGLYVLATSAGEATAQLSGRFAHEAAAGDKARGERCSGKLRHRWWTDRVSESWTI